MAEKLPTAIGQVIEGKFVSVTICHECHDVSDHCLQLFNCFITFVKISENFELFFDISLPIPEDDLLKVYTHDYVYKCDNIKTRTPV